MKELSVRSTIKNLILTNESDLVSGLTFQGNARTINQVTYSAITPPTGYYFLNVIVSSARTRNRAGFGRTTALAPSEAVYDVNIDIADYAIGTPGEDQLFEKMDADFQLFSDRLVAKLRESYRLTGSDGLEFRLDNDRNVTKNNLSQSWEEAAQYHALLYCRISFSMIEECTDDAVLY